jgi:hypothetical protein
MCCSQYVLLFRVGLRFLCCLGACCMGGLLGEVCAVATNAVRGAGTLLHLFLVTVALTRRCKI